MYSFLALLISCAFAGTNFTATAYTADCKGCSGITKTGINVNTSKKKIMAVDPKVLKLGKCYQVKFSDGHSSIYLAADTGSAIKGNRVDLLLKSRKSAVIFGRQKVTISGPVKC